MSEFKIFPRFREFVLLFGAKHGENEIGPPQLRFRRLTEGGSCALDQVNTGFGIGSNSTLHSLPFADMIRNRLRTEIC